MFADIVGGGASSRLFQQLREDRGLAYSVYAALQPYRRCRPVLRLCRDRPARGGGGGAADRARSSPRPPRTSTQRELDRVRDPGQGRPADVAGNAAGARPIYVARQLAVYGRLVEPAEVVAELDAVTLDAGPRGRRAMLAGPRARATIGVPAVARGVSDSTTIVAEPWADYGLIDCGHGRKLERYGPVRVVRPEPQAMWAPARDRLGSRRDLRPGSDEEGGGRWVQHRPVPREGWELARDAVTLHTPR